MGDPIRWGILGAANFAQMHMGPAIHAAKGSRLAGLATRNPEKAAGFLDFAPDCQVHDTYDALLTSDNIDAVYIPLPNSLHVDWSLKALAAGKHVLCEKPMAMAAEEYDALIAARDASGKLAAEAYMIVHHPQWQKARAVLAEGILGDLMHVDAFFSFRNTDPDNIRNMADMGGGGLRDIGVYALGCIRFATGQDPRHLHARLKMDHGVDVAAWIDLEFDGFRAQSMVSTRMAKRQIVTFQGNDGTMTLTTPFNAGVFDQAEIVLETQAGARQILRYPGVNQYVLQVEAFGAAIRDGATFAWPLEQSRGTQTMLDAALAGDRT